MGRATFPKAAIEAIAGAMIGYAGDVTDKRRIAGRSLVQAFGKVCPRIEIHPSARLSALAEHQAAAAPAANAAYAARFGALAEHGAAVATPVVRTSFDFLDHELMFAGGYALAPATPVVRGADFDFLDHELMFAGGYALRPAAAAEMAAE